MIKPLQNIVHTFKSWGNTKWQRNTSVDPPLCTRKDYCNCQLLFHATYLNTIYSHSSHYLYIHHVFKFYTTLQYCCYTPDTHWWNVEYNNWQWAHCRTSWVVFFFAANFSFSLCWFNDGGCFIPTIAVESNSGVLLTALLMLSFIRRDCIHCAVAALAIEFGDAVTLLDAWEIGGKWRRDELELRLVFDEEDANSCFILTIAGQLGALFLTTTVVDFADDIFEPVLVWRNKETQIFVAGTQTIINSFCKSWWVLVPYCTIQRAGVTDRIKYAFYMPMISHLCAQMAEWSKAVVLRSTMLYMRGFEPHSA